MAAPAFPDCEPMKVPSIDDCTQDTYSNSYSTNKKSPTTYVESSSVSKTSYSRPGEIDGASYGTLIPPGGV